MMVTMVKCLQKLWGTGDQIQNFAFPPKLVTADVGLQTETVCTPKIELTSIQS